MRVRVATDDGELSFRARWRHRPIDLQRRILYLLRQGKAIWLEDEWGRSVCLKAECVWGASVDGRADGVAAPANAPAHPRGDTALSGG